MARLGILTLQALDQTDIFFKEDVYLDGTTDSGFNGLEVEEPGFGNDLQWVTGDVPQTVPVNVEGDTSVLFGWFKAESLPGVIQLRIYIEYEPADELLPDENPRQENQ